MSREHPEGHCPFLEVWSVVGGKWRGTLLYCLASRSLRFSELRLAAAPISRKVLTQELRALQRDGLIHRRRYPENPPKVVYRLSALGQTLAPILRQIDDWKVNLEKVEQARAVYDQES